MFGRIERENNNLIAATIAGPNPGIVDRVGYECEIDYRVVLTNGPAGVGTVGVYDCNNIIYNPACCIGTDEDTGEDIKIGVLKVDCVCACGVAGGEYAEYIRKNNTHDNTTFAIPFYANSPADATEHCDYYSLMASDSYPLTYNPYGGQLTAVCMQAQACMMIGSANCHLNIQYGCICSADCLRIQACGIGLSYHDSAIYIGNDECVCIYGQRIINCAETCICGNTTIAGIACMCGGFRANGYGEVVGGIVAHQDCCYMHDTFIFGVSYDCRTVPGLLSFCWDGANERGYYVTCDIDLNSLSVIFNGTMAQWNALTTDQKKTYTNVSITDY